jgi:hypothetical protein
VFEILDLGFANALIQDSMVIDGPHTPSDQNRGLWSTAVKILITVESNWSITMLYPPLSQSR